MLLLIFDIIIIIDITNINIIIIIINVYNNVYEGLDFKFI